MQKTTITGPYHLDNEAAAFGGWIRPTGADADTVTMAFPVEGWSHSAAVTVRQTGPQTIEGTVHGPAAGSDDHDRAWDQAMAALSLDYDATGYAEIGDRDPVIGKLQRETGYLRPVLFHSPYEAACAFVIAHRMRIEQGRAIRARMARDHGETIDGTHAFPTPQVLRTLTEIPGVAAEKIERLHLIADAALAGRLDRARLRAMPLDEALADMKTLRGIGDFFAAGIVLRGAGLADAVTSDEMTRAGMRRLYGSDDPAITEAWRPFRMWCSVLVHATERRARAH